MYIVLLIFAMIISSTCFANECNIRSDADSIALWTEDGLRLVLDSQEGVCRYIEIGTASFETGTPLIRLEEVAVDETAPNLLVDPSPEAWGMQSDTLDMDANGHPGQWFRLSGSDSVKPHRRIVLAQSEPKPVAVSGYCQANVEGPAFGWYDRNMAINCQVRYLDGSTMPEQSAYFGQYDHGPQLSSKVICPDKPIDFIDISLSVPPGECTAWYRDIEVREGEYEIAEPKAGFTQINSTVLQEYQDIDKGLSTLVSLMPLDKFIEIRCHIQSLDASDRAVSAYLSIPFDAVGGLWHDDMRSYRNIEEGTQYRDAVWYGAGKDGFNNRYPFACVEDKNGQGLGLATSVLEPRVFQTEYDAGKKEFRIRFDLGLSPDAGKWANCSSFSVYLFTFEDGFREAIAKYHRLFKPAFTNRVERQGQWLAFMTPEAIGGGWEDLHFQFLESVSHMGWAEKQGMDSFRYMEPWIFHQQFPDESYSDMVSGPADPGAALELSTRIASIEEDSLPLDSKRRYPAYLSSYSADKWGNPQGYLFRSPTGGRNENMMIVNPNEHLPTPDAPYSSGGWDRETLREAMRVRKQLHLPGWTWTRVTHKPFASVDQSVKYDGSFSIRFDDIEGSSYYEKHYRGLSQVISHEASEDSTLRFSYIVRGKNIPATGTDFKWTVTCWKEDGTTQTAIHYLKELGKEWKRREHVVEIERGVKYINITLDSNPFHHDPTVLWLDEVRLAKDGAGENLLRNGGFEEHEMLSCQLDGVYLDTMECYLCNLNYRREHWNFTDSPLTFDWAREPTLHQIFTHADFAKSLANDSEFGHLLRFGNCSPFTPFAAPYLDVLGGEVFWKQGDKWVPKSDSEFNFIRFMCHDKPFCLLQYSDLSVEEQTKYAKQCLFYGVFPSNQADPNGHWYWANPIVVDKHREVFATYVPIIQQVAEAGWESITRASSSNDKIWIERFGAGKEIYFTIFNSSGDIQKTKIEISLSELFGEDKEDNPPRVLNVLNEEEVSARLENGMMSFEIHIDPEDVHVFQIAR